MTIRQELTVQENGLIQVRSPELRSGDVAEVIVVVRSAAPESQEQSVGEKKTWRDFMGCFKGDHGTSDNESIDRDLAASYMDTHEPGK